jgi:WD40 repeat protein
MNGQLGLYDLQGKIKKSYLGHVNKNFCMDVGCYKYKGSTVLIGGSEDGSVCMWDL